MDISHIASVLDDFALRHDKEVTIGLLDHLHPDKYRGDTHLAKECREWLKNTPNPSLGRILVMGFLLNQGLVCMTRPHAAFDDPEDSWGALIESKQIHDIIKDSSAPENAHEKSTLAVAAFAEPPEQPEQTPDTWGLGDETEQDVDLSEFEKELHALSKVD